MNGTPEHPSPSLSDDVPGDEPPTADLLDQLDRLTGQTPEEVAERQRLCDDIITRTLPVADRLAAHYGVRGAEHSRRAQAILPGHGLDGASSAPHPGSPLGHQRRPVRPEQRARP